MRSETIIALLLSSAFLFADTNREERVALLECKMNQVRSETVYCNRNGAQFASGRPITCGYNLSAFGEVLHWKFYEGGNDYTVKNTTNLEPYVLGNLKRLQFEWKTGYRIGASYGFSDQWDFTASFVRMNPEGDDDVLAPSLGELELVSPYGVSGASASVSAKLKYSIFNFEMGSSYFVSRSFYLRPHYGVQAAWIHQKFFASAPSFLAWNRFQNNFSGGGLRMGIDSKWFFHRYWNVVFNASTSALYGKCKVVMRDYIDTLNHIEADISRLAPSIQSLIGLCWERNFAEDNNHIMLMLAYENCYWWRQNQLMRFETFPIAEPYGTRLSEDLSAQGLTFNMTLFF